jgi:hypothetical protein
MGDGPTNPYVDMLCMQHASVVAVHYLQPLLVDLDQPRCLDIL